MAPLRVPGRVHIASRLRAGRRARADVVRELELVEQGSVDHVRHLHHRQAELACAQESQQATYTKESKEAQPKGAGEARSIAEMAAARAPNRHCHWSPGSGYTEAQVGPCGQQKPAARAWLSKGVVKTRACPAACAQQHRLCSSGRRADRGGGGGLRSGRWEIGAWLRRTRRVLLITPKMYSVCCISDMTCAFHGGTSTHSGESKNPYTCGDQHARAETPRLGTVAHFTSVPCDARSSRSTAGARLCVGDAHGLEDPRNVVRVEHRPSGSSRAARDHHLRSVLPGILSEVLVEDERLDNRLDDPGAAEREAEGVLRDGSAMIEDD